MSASVDCGVKATVRFWVRFGSLGPVTPAMSPMYLEMKQIGSFPDMSKGQDKSGEVWLESQKHRRVSPPLFPRFEPDCRAMAGQWEIQPHAAWAAAGGVSNPLFHPGKADPRLLCRREFQEQPLGSRVGMY